MAEPGAHDLAALLIAATYTPDDEERLQATGKLADALKELGYEEEGEGFVTPSVTAYYIDRNILENECNTLQDLVDNLTETRFHSFAERKYFIDGISTADEDGMNVLVFDSRDGAITFWEQEWNAP